MISFDEYIDPKSRMWTKIGGWTEHGAFVAMKCFDDYQKSNLIKGDVAEIGVHHGQFFIAMALLCTEQEKGIAVDVFNWQHLNIDKSGCGNLDIFHSHILSICPKNNIIIRQADSMSIDKTDDEYFGKRSCRIFHIDGGHTPDHVINDIEIAQVSICKKGVIIVDDFLHPKWPGVTEGIFRYILNGMTSLVPFAYGNNKIYMCFEGEYDNYFKVLNSVGKAGVAGRKVVTLSDLKVLYISFKSTTPG